MLWGGRFERGPHPDMVAFTRSTDIDLELLPQDVAATVAHALVLEAAGLLNPDERASIEHACNDLMARWERKEIVPSAVDEDVHTLVERSLTEALGDAGKRIHAGRSRNDLVATDLRLWCRDASGAAIDELRLLIEDIARFAEGQSETLMPGYTHLQRAQPVSAGFHMLAHGFALLRDVERFARAHRSADVSVLGAGALAGNTLELDPEVAREALGFSSVFENAMDAVSDRDFACDLLYACSMVAVHLSRLAEEIVLWTSSEFGFVRLGDDWSTGSSMMPQKRNPDAAELIRGRSAGAIADLTGLLILLKGLPLAYDRDLQEDKRFVFGSLHRTLESIRATRGVLGAIRFDKQRMAEAAGSSATWATDVAEALVRAGVPFREAHERTGRLVAAVQGEGRELPTESELVEAGAGHLALDPLSSLHRRNARGGTAPGEVKRQVDSLRAAAAKPDLLLH
jgi:argininosuccinate lyase